MGPRAGNATRGRAVGSATADGVIRTGQPTVADLAGCWAAGTSGRSLPSPPSSTPTPSTPTTSQRAGREAPAPLAAATRDVADVDPPSAGGAPAAPSPRGAP